VKLNRVCLPRLATLLIFQLIIPAGFTASGRKSSSPRPPNSQQLATDVRTEFLHAWRGYKKYAWDRGRLARIRPDRVISRGDGSFLETGIWPAPQAIAGRAD